MVREQRVLIVEAGLDPVASLSAAEMMGCVAVMRGVPEHLVVVAEAEGWTLPHVLIETWEEAEQDAAPPLSQLESA